MAENLQLQKTVNFHGERFRHRRRLEVAAERFSTRLPGVSNWLTREAARPQAAHIGLHATIIVDAGGTNFEVGDRATLDDGTFVDPAVFLVTEVAAGVVTDGRLMDPGNYSVAPVASTSCTAFGFKNGRTAPAGLEISVSNDAVVLGITAAEVLAGLKGQTNLAGTVPTLTRARHIRIRNNGRTQYIAQGIPGS